MYKVKLYGIIMKQVYLFLTIKWEVLVLKKFTNIVSNLDALKLKKVEKFIYNNVDDKVFILPKVVPFKGVNTDMLYIKDNKILFIKFMDTTEDLFSFLDEEILEIMKEEFELMCENMSRYFPQIAYNYVFVMPYIDYIEDTYGMDDFVKENIICGSRVKELITEDDINFDQYLKEANDEISLSMYLLRICTEYFAFTTGVNTSNKLKKISFHDKYLDYRFALMDDEQIVNIASANYGNHAILGGSGTGKSAVMMGRVIKLSKIYPHHNFLILTFTKQQVNKYIELLDILKVDTENIMVYTFSSFIFKLAKINNLVIDYNLVKSHYDKAFANIMKQVDNSVKNKKMFKGIFIDEAENMNEDDIKLIYQFLYSSKRVFNVNVCKSYNINNSLNIYKCKIKEDIEYEDELFLEKNYRQSEEVVDFINRFCDRSNDYIRSLRDNISSTIFMKTKSIYKAGMNVNILKVDDLDDQIHSVIWEIQHLIKDCGFKPEDIAVVYPFNKKKLKNGKMIYFQYMLRKSLEDADIAYMYADDTVTNLTPKTGVTISNIYSIKSLSYKAIIICELEMLYNHKVNAEDQDYQVNDFVGDLNKVYTAMTRVENYLSIIVSYDRDSSDIFKLLMD